MPKSWFSLHSLHHTIFFSPQYAIRPIVSFRDLLSTEHKTGLLMFHYRIRLWTFCLGISWSDLGISSSSFTVTTPNCTKYCHLSNGSNIPAVLFRITDLSGLSGCLEASASLRYKWFLVSFKWKRDKSNFYGVMFYLSIFPKLKAMTYVVICLLTFYVLFSFSD